MRSKTRGIGLKLRLAPVVDHADRDIHLGVDHPLRRQLRHHPVGDQLVVFRSAQPRSHRLKGQHEAAEILVLVKSLGFIDTSADTRPAPRPVTADLRLNSTSVSGLTVPSRCRCSSALGRRRNQARETGTTPPAVLVVICITLFARVLGAKLAAVAAVAEVDHQPNHQPDHKPRPGNDRQPSHQQHAKQDAQHWNHRPAGHAETRAAAPGPSPAESALRSTPAQRRRECRCSKDRPACRYPASPPGMPTTNPATQVATAGVRKSGMHLAEQVRQQPVPRHGEPHPRLAHLEDKDRGDHPQHRAKQHHQPHPVQAVRRRVEAKAS